MKIILIARTFRGQIKKFKRTFQEEDIVQDVKDFILHGLRKGETYLKSQEVYSVTIETVKLRFYIQKSSFRYLLAVIDDYEYLPIVIDRKTGVHGKNLSFKADKKTTEAITRATVSVLEDYRAFPNDQARAGVYHVIGL